MTLEERAEARADICHAIHVDTDELNAIFAVIDRLVLEERERCARIADDAGENPIAKDIAVAIRARAEKEAK